jgi:hypothetical protein
VSRFIAMRKRQKLKTQRKHKKHVARTPAAVAKFKERFLKQLALGRSPGVAARGVGIARSTAYGWKREDREFDAAWVDAVETSLDKLETELYDIAKEDPDNIASRLRAIELTLRYRRYGTGGSRTPHQQTNFMMNVTMEEHFKRCERLGLPRPEIECDYEETDAATRTQRK